MGKFDEYLEKVKDLAEDASDGAKIVFGDVFLFDASCKHFFL